MLFAAVRYAIEKLEYKSTQLILFARALGCGPATRIARTLCEHALPPMALILQSPYTSILDLAAQHTEQDGNGVLRRALQNAWRTIDDIEAVTAPTLVLAGARDTQIPPEHAKAVFKASGAKCRKISIAAKATNSKFNKETDVLAPIHKFLSSLEQVRSPNKSINSSSKSNK